MASSFFTDIKKKKYREFRSIILWLKYTNYHTNTQNWNSKQDDEAYHSVFLSILPLYSLQHTMSTLQHARTPLQIKYCLPNSTLQAKFTKSLTKNTALHSDGEAKMDGALTAFAGPRGSHSLLCTKPSSCISRSGYLRFLRKCITCSKWKLGG